MNTPTAHDFETALVAKHPDGRIALRVVPGSKRPWLVEMPRGRRAWAADADLPALGFIPAVPVTTPREALDAARALAYELPKGAMIPAGTPHIVQWEEGEMRFLPEGASCAVPVRGPHYERRLLDAPAPARPEGAEQIESQIEAWVFSEDGAALDAKHLRTLADRIAREAGR